MLLNLFQSIRFKGKWRAYLFRVCLSACDGGYLDLLEFAVNEGGELIEDACVATAMSNGHRDVAEYLAGHIKENIEKRINRLKTESSISHVL